MLTRETHTFPDSNLQLAKASTENNGHKRNEVKSSTQMQNSFFERRKLAYKHNHHFGSTLHEAKEEMPLQTLEIPSISPFLKHAPHFFAYAIKPKRKTTDPTGPSPGAWAKPRCLGCTRQGSLIASPRRLWKLGRTCRCSEIGFGSLSFDSILRRKNASLNTVKDLATHWCARFTPTCTWPVRHLPTAKLSEQAPTR